MTTIATGVTGISRAAFDRALLSFRNKLLPEEIQAFTGSTLEDIRKEARAIQDMQEKRGITRNMRRIQPLINGLAQFSGVIEVFVQSKPEVLAFIWGPIKFLLQVVSSYTEALDKLLNAFETLGENLSRFQVFEKTFHNVPRMQDVIVMIYEDILRFYQATLSCFRGKGWRRLFMSLWNTFDDRFGNILSDLDQHKELVDREASATHIAEARSSRQAAQKAEEDARAYREKQNLLQIKIWLEPINYDAFIAKLGSSYRTTGLWFVQEDSVKAWLDMADKSNRLMWLTGIPGAGKTFLSASFLRHTQLIHDKNVHIAYAFLSHDNDHTSAMIMRTLISQLLHHNLQSLARFDEIRGSKTHPPSSQEEVQEMFKYILGDIGVYYLFIDGLDEIDIEERKKVLDTLCSLLVEADNLKIFLSSRDEVDISRSLAKDEVVAHVHRVDLTGKNQQDIKTYITEEGKGVFERFMSLDDDTRQKVQGILDRVCDRAEGMFLWARLVIYDLKSQIDMEGLEDVDHNLPVGLDAAYGRILNRINEKLSLRERDLARRVLGWVMCSTRPLSLNELKQALAVRKGDNCINQQRKIFIRLDELCGPIIEFDAENNIHFVHFTAKEYLTSDYSGRFIRHADAHQDIAITCIRYLSFSCFDINIPDDKVKENVLSGEYCLHLYAERNWIYHVKHAIELDHDHSWTKSFVSLLVKFVQLRLDEGLPQMIANQDISSEWRFLETLNSSPNVREHLINHCIFNSGEGLSKGISFDPLTLQKSTQRFRKHLEDIFTYSSMSNDQDQLQSIHKNYGGNIFKCSRVQCLQYVNGFDTQTKRDEHLNTHTRPFQCNVQGCAFVSIGFATMGALKAHLRRYHQAHSSDIDKDTRGHSSLNTCPHLGVLDLTKLLFDAISTGNLSMVKSALKLGVDLNCGTFNNNGESFLHYTLAAGHKDIFQLLLEKGASADTLNRVPTMTILNYAIFKGLLEYVKLLLEWGASVNRLEEGASGNTIDIRVDNIPPPLVVAIENNQLESARLLLEHGADVDSKDLGGSTALILAILMSPDLVKLLLENGASANTKSSAGGTYSMSPSGTPALIVAIGNSQSESARLLLEHGADVDSKDLGGRAALILAIANNHPDIVKILLEKGVSPNTLSSDSSPALIVAVENGQSESARLLLERGANVDSKDLGGRTALILAIANNHPDIVKILLEKGASPKSISSNRTSALIVAVQNGQSESVRLLLEHGADIDSKDQNGDAALILAIANNHTDIVKILLEKGASPNALSSDRSPALMIAIQNDQSESARLLLEHGADVDSKDQNGDAALILAIGRSLDMAKLLIEGANVNPIPPDRTPASILAIERKKFEVAQLLLEKGADAYARYPNGEAAIIHAIMFDDRCSSDATRGSKLAVIQLLISAGVSVNSISSNRTPALILAIEREDLEVARLLLEKGADANARDPNGEAAIIHAIRIDNRYLSDPRHGSKLAIIKLLISAGINVNSISSDRTPALILAIKHEDLEVARLLLEKGADAARKPDGEAAIIHAIRVDNRYSSDAISESKLAVIKLLISAGINVNSISSDRIPALILAIEYKELKVVQLLLEKGADANTRDPNGEAAIIYAVKIRDRYMSEFRLAVVRLLISTGINMNTKDSQGTPLLALLVFGRDKLKDAAELFISKGAERDVEVGTKFINKLGVLQKTDGLFEAIYFGMIKAATVLIEKTSRERITAPDISGVTPLMAAILSPYYEYAILEKLLLAGADVNFINRKTGDSALLLAAKRITLDSTADELKLLLKSGANVNITDREGQTALHKMAEIKHIVAAEALLQHQARTDIPDKKGKTALAIWPELDRMSSRWKLP